ncbi:hypothetical protein MOSE0_L02014 [Monosporozyma servazzii]
MSFQSIFAAAKFDVTPFVTTLVVADAQGHSRVFTIGVIVLVVAYLLVFYLTGGLIKLGKDKSVSFMNQACLTIFIFAFIYAQMIIIRLDAQEEGEAANTGV